MAKNIAMKFDPKKFTKDQIPFFIIMIPLCIFMGLPLIYLFSTAFKPLNELLEFPPKFFVKTPTFKNFTDLLTRSGSTGLPIYRYLINSIFISLSVVILSVLFSSMAGYILSKKDFRGRNISQARKICIFQPKRRLRQSACRCTPNSKRNFLCSLFCSTRC